MDKEFLIVDIETTSKDADEAEIKVFGAYDPILDKYFIYKWNNQTLAKVVGLLHEYKIIVTFNGRKYDIPILERHGIPVDFKHIDVYEIFRYKRTQLIRPKGFDSYSLKALVLQLGLDGIGKGEIDYNIFKKTEWTPAEQELIIHYLKQDLVSTWKLWEYLIKRFEIFGKFVQDKDRELYKHITTPLSTYAYKAICYGAGISELYDERPKYREFPKPISNTPRRQVLTNNIAYMKFTYLYPHTVIQYNLASYECDCCSPEYTEGKFHGKNFYIVKGYYCQRKQGPVEKFLKELYIASRTDNELRMLAMVVFSQLYNVMTNASYYSLYNPYAAYDLVSLAKQQLKIILGRFEEAGYFVVHVDIDNVFIYIDESKGQSLQSLLHTKDKILAYLKTKMPFPSEAFDLVYKDTLKYIEFFKNDNPNHPFLRKGEYVYINNDGFVGSRGVSEDIIQRVISRVI